MKTIKVDNIEVKAWADYVEIDAEAERQIRNLAKLPFIYKHIAVMPDVHAGKGATVGTVIATKDHLIPAAIGVDIGCGMMAVRLPFKTQQLNKLPQLRHAIEKSVPVGNESHRAPLAYLENVKELIRHDVDQKAWLQFGTLGSGNHFIEISKDQDDYLWAVVHSGSRGVGHYLATKHIQTAKQQMGKQLALLPDPDLAYFEQGTDAFDEYVKDLLWAQEYALYNREAMMDLILRALSTHLFNTNQDLLKESDLIINCHHNYSRKEEHFGEVVWVSRKGAVSAQKGEYGIIPGSMGNKSYIVRGKGNIESFCSCSHGAGRRLSRTRAKKMYTLEDLKNQTQGVECRKDEKIIDEIPAAYKNIDDVMRSQAELVEIVYTLKQLICVKG